ncbi:bifunctional methylenetetrahydrofolate dehydrogenase/methenyltetrahydrofolate cyclohydrolase FolD [uncultured Fusobacterium sp.]|uniref:bifunctional methylenetetrahydrofolate dehydrogenase/methenyltetrahydrofolate cyclohydrolase FolD n=1 Tax=uncultured Fusobacterium sp. TaxID=159267 RepID=UPI002803C49E|nr:bifunctional methylenetetrahydrofolate dehydrogenase/methenyltetrahydrofolate cyclohydrolase FolD [uncultured Fusobacterium sp.]
MILDGKKTSSQIKEEIKEELKGIKEKVGKVPGLAIVLVGENPASKIYVNSKIKGCAELGFESFAHYLPENVTEEELLNVIRKLNEDEKVDGILVQLPLPKHIDEKKVVDTIAFSKDVDGFKPENMGLLFLGDKNSIKPCTPSGIVELFKRYELEVEGKDVVIIGRSNIVGKPMAGFFINEGATVTICNSKTKNLADKLKEADIIVAAMGVAKFVKADMVKDGAIIIDVGINRTEEGLFGDVDFENVAPKCKWITPVPGGVGPMTVAMLFKNTLSAFKRNKKLV